MPHHSPQPAADERGISTVISHVLSVAITTLLIMGLVAGATGFLDIQKDRAAEKELRTVGTQLASELAAADRLARTSNAVTVTSHQPETVAGSTYTVTLESCPAGACVILAAAEYDYTTNISVHNQTELSLTATGDGAFQITADGGTGVPILDQRRIEMSPRVGIGRSVGVGPNLGLGAGLSRTPIADFTFTPGVPQTGDPVTFDGGPSRDPDGTVINWSWDFNSDGTPEKYGQRPTYTFSDTGTHNVTLEVEDGGGLTSSFTREIDVSGLEYNNDMKVLPSSQEIVSFTVTNEHNQSVHIERLMIDPEPANLDELSEDIGGGWFSSEADDPPHEIQIDAGDDGSIDGYVDWDADGGIFSPGDSLDIKEDGAIVRIDDAGDEQGGVVTLSKGQVANITVRYFPASALNEEINFGVRYRIGTNANANVFNDTVASP